MQYNDESLITDDGADKLNNEIKKNKPRMRDEEQGFELHIIKEEEFNYHIKQLFMFLLEADVYLTQLKYVLNKTRYRVSAFMLGIDNSINLNKKHIEQLQQIDPLLKSNIKLEVNNKKYKYYNAKTSILSCCNNQNQTLRLLLLLMLLNNIKFNSNEANKMAQEQLQILEHVTNLM